MTRQFPLPDKPPGPHSGAAFYIRAVAAILIFVFAFSAAPVFGQSQTNSESDPKPANDWILLREMSRFRPEFAAELKADLQAAITPQARREVLKKYEERISLEKDDLGMIRENLRPEGAERDLAGLGHLVFVAQMMKFRIVQEHVDTYMRRHAFEDAVIRDVGFKDFNELYDLFRKTHPDDLGYKFMDEAKEYFDRGDVKKFAERMDLLQNVLKSFRQKSMTPGGSILGEITPYTPVEPAKPAAPPQAPQSVTPGAALSPCQQICDAQPDPTARSWCKSHCRDNRMEANQPRP